jgi:hypothetical protein
MIGEADYPTWAFQYEGHYNRFDPPELIQPGEPFIKLTRNKTKPAGPETNPNPIPNGAMVDLVMTHSPPYDHLDNANDRKPRGCPHLLVAVDRVKPKIHAFGHVCDVSRANHPSSCSASRRLI